MATGKFIVFEGGEGTGKSTQIKRLHKDLTDKGIDCILTREPGGSDGAEKIRDLLVKGDPGQWDPLTEATLFLAARRDHVERVIKPALAAGKWVLSDRYHDSTLAYSCYGHGVARQKLDDLYKLLLGDFTPDLVFVLDVDPEVGLARAHSRGDLENRIEKKGLAFHQKVNQGFRDIATSKGDKYKLIDANQPLEGVWEAIFLVASSLILDTSW